MVKKTKTPYSTLFLLFLFIIMSVHIGVTKDKIQLRVKRDTIPPIEGMPLFFRVSVKNVSSEPIPILKPPLFRHILLRVKVKGPVDERCVDKNPDLLLSPVILKKSSIVLKPGESYSFWYNATEFNGVMWAGDYEFKFTISSEQPWYKVVYSKKIFDESNWLKVQIKRMTNDDLYFVKYIFHELYGYQINTRDDLYILRYCKTFLLNDFKKFLSTNMNKRFNPNIYIAYFLGKSAYWNKKYTYLPEAPPKIALQMGLNGKTLSKKYSLFHGCEEVNDKTIEWAEYFADRGLPGSYLRSKIAECAGFFYLLKGKMKKALHYFNIAGEKYERDRKIAILIQQYSGFHE